MARNHHIILGARYSERSSSRQAPNARGLLGTDVGEMRWGVADHWSDPFETLLCNRGDCEDDAILKYAALVEAGIPKDDVKIAILKTFFPNERCSPRAVTRLMAPWAPL